MKHFYISALLALLMSMVGTPATAYDIEVANNDGVTIYYVWINNQTELAVTYRGSYYSAYDNEYTGNVVIPSTVTYSGKTYPVTRIGDYAFYNCPGLTSVTIPNSVTIIGNIAFQNCFGLTSVTIPNSVTNIGNNAFEGCSDLKSVTIPNSVTNIGNKVFQGCSSLTGVTIGNSITSIGSYSFYGCSSLTSVIIGNSVTSIGLLAFYGCSSLTSVAFPNSVTSIGNCAFQGCSALTSVDFPNSVTNIGDFAFQGCYALMSMIVPNSVTSIGIKAFLGTAWYNNQLDGLVYAGKVAYRYKGTMPSNTSITLKEGTLGIAGEVFYGCSNLTSVTISNSVTNIGSLAFYGCSSLTSVTIPNSVTSIGVDAFFGCSGLNSVTVMREMPVSIGYDTFPNRANATLYVPFGCKAAYQVADYWKEFKQIVEMESQHSYITFADINVKALCVANWDANGDGELDDAEAAAVTDLGEVFQSKERITSFDELKYFTGLTSIGCDAFHGCSSLTSVTIPNSVTSIDYDAFATCGLTSVTIPSSVTSISDNPFRGNSDLTSISVASGNTKYDSSNNCNAIIETASNTLITGCKNTIIPNSVTSIGNYAFNVCHSLTSVTIPNSVTSIGVEAFFGCSGLTSVTIPNSVTSIGSMAFYECSSLTSVTVMRETPVSIDSNTFSNRANATLYVPSGCKAAYQAASCWKEFKQIVEMEPQNSIITFADANVKVLCVANWDTNGDGELDEGEAATVTDLGEVFKSNNSISSFDELKYFTGMTDIWDAFAGCSSLTSITIPNSVTSIGSYAFGGCTGLTSVTIPNSVTSIGWDAFDGTIWYSNQPDGLVYAGKVAYKYKGTMPDNTNIDIEEGTVSISPFAFNDCSGLTSVTIPNSVTSIGLQAFGFCSGLTSVTIPNSVTSIGLYAFCECSSLTIVTISNSVTIIDSDAFAGCYSLTSVTIPNSVTSIGSEAFWGCSGLTRVNIPNSVTSIGYGAFEGCSGLTSITVALGNTHYDSRNSCNAIIETTSNTLIAGCKNTIIPNSVTSIGYRAFSGCKYLTSVTIPNSMTSIGRDAFRDCSNLKSVTVMRETPVSIYSDSFSNRANATLYVPSGCKAAYQAAEYWKEFKTIKEYLHGDVNLDEETDVVDVVDIARFVVAMPRDVFHVLLADLNNDQTVNVADAVVLVNVIAGDQNFSRTTTPVWADTEENLTLEQQDANTFSMSLDNWRDYTAFQFDLYLSEDTDVEQVLLIAQRKQQHQLLYNKIGEGHYRVAVLSTSNQLFKGNCGELLSFRLNGMADDIVVSDILFFTTDGSSYAFDSISSGTETNAIADAQQKRSEPQPVYDLQGRRMSSQLVGKGLYIVNGKKVLK